MDRVKNILQSFAGIDEEHFALSEGMWLEKTYSKGDFYNQYKSVCKYLGLVMDGVFRTYYVDDETGEEKNLFFYSQNQVVVAYKSFVTQTPCNYYTQALTPANIYYIRIDELLALYKQSHQWEHLGRLVAETAFVIGSGRMESFLFQSPEQRYLELIQDHPDIFNNVPLYHIASYLGIQGPSLSRIRKRMASK